MDKKLHLKAIEHNWGRMRSGDWNTVTWLIYYDGSYDIISQFNPAIEPDDLVDIFNRNERPRLIEKKQTGEMDSVIFSKLCEAIKCEPWRDPTIDVIADDGVAWELVAFSDNGSVEKTSGKLDYIYGHRVLETIVSLLPTDGNLYSSAAYVSVKKK